MTYATVDDVAAELGRPTPTDDVTVSQWTRWLQRAENKIRGRIPDLAARVATEPSLEGRVVDVESAAVARKVLNPEGLRQSTRAIDDGSITKVVDSSRSVGEVTILDSEWADLIPGDSSAAFSTRPGFEPDQAVCPW